MRSRSFIRLRQRVARVETWTQTHAGKLLDGTYITLAKVSPLWAGAIWDHLRNRKYFSAAWRSLPCGHARNPSASQGRAESAAKAFYGTE